MCVHVPAAGAAGGCKPPDMVLVSQLWSSWRELLSHFPASSVLKMNTEIAAYRLCFKTLSRKKKKAKKGSRVKDELLQVTYEEFVGFSGT